MNTSFSTHRGRGAWPLVLGLSLGLGGCAQFIGQPDQTIPILSTPENATVVIRNSQGRRVFKGTTPTIVSLPKSDGSYFGGQNYSVEISLPGYLSRQIIIQSSATFGYVLGNVLWGWPVGAVGGLVIDPWSGNMYSLAPRTINVQLSTQPAPPAEPEDDPIMVKP